MTTIDSLNGWVEKIDLSQPSSTSISFTIEEQIARGLLFNHIQDIPLSDDAFAIIIKSDFDLEHMDLDDLLKQKLSSGLL